MGSGITIKIDDGPFRKFQGMIERGEIEQAVTRAITTTADKVKGIVQTDADRFYHGGKGWIGSAVQQPQTGFMRAMIPIKGKRGTIGNHFPTAGGAYISRPGGAYGFNGRGAWGKLRGKRAAKVKARIVKGQVSELPDTLPHQGGNPPFMYQGIAYTRTTRKRKPIARVVGVAVPQMVENRARGQIEKHLRAELQRNITAEFDKLF